MSTFKHQKEYIQLEIIFLRMLIQFLLIYEEQLFHNLETDFNLFFQE